MRLSLSAAWLSCWLACLLLPKSASALNCSTFDPKEIKMITFDTFAALMQTPESLLANLGYLLPQLTPDQVTNFTIGMIDTYGDYFGLTFDPATQQPEPFPWVINLAVTQQLEAFGLNTTILPGSPTFQALTQTWSQLTPWPQTLETLQLLQANGYLVAPLSNGDAETLINATNIFRPQVVMNEIYSSDYPIGAFKPLPAMYAQLANQWGIEHVLHVAGSAIDAFGARSYGLYNALLRDTPQEGPQPCWTLANITMLPAVLGISSA